MDLVAIGHVTLDHVHDTIRPGGAALYAAVAAHRLGAQVGLLSSFGDDFPVTAVPEGIAVVNVPSRSTTAFEHTILPEGRRLRLLSRATDLQASDLPVEWSRAPLALLCPVAGEVDPALASAFEDAAIGVLPQGWLRARQAGGLMAPCAWEDAALVLPQTQLLVLSEEDAAPLEQDVGDWIDAVPLAALTRGPRGAVLFVNGERYHVEPDVAAEADATGAGDVFGAVLFLEYHRRGDPWEAAAMAACAAAASVEEAGPGAVPDRIALEERLRAYRVRCGG